jgi:hypothetical protein
LVGCHVLDWHSCLQAFVKIREQARAYLDKPAELMAGLNLLSTTNLDYFQVGGGALHSLCMA